MGVKIVGKPIKRVINEEGHTELTLLITNYRNQKIVKELEKDKDYRVEMNVVKSKRSIESNNLFWKIVHDISIAVNGTLANDSDDWEIYLQLLERTGAKFEYIACLPEGEELLKKQFRAVKLMNTFEHNNKVFNSYKVYYGSSHFNSTEMTLLISNALDVAAENGIDTSVYEGEI